MFARLEEAGYRRCEILGITREYVEEVLFHERDMKGHLRLPPPAVEERDERRRLAVRGWPAHEIERRLRREPAGKAKRGPRRS